MLRHICAAVFCLVAPVCAGDPFIAEFMASNQNSITDEDGSKPDWIEIRNPGPGAVNLNGWFLTDNANNKTKWQFPAVTLNANTQLIVFASGKDRRTPGANLHTNFSLSADGEYLALVQPDGVTVAQEFAPAYPPQSPDISYGTSVPVTDTLLIDRATSVNKAAKAYVPVVNDPIGTTWRNPAFNDTAWLSGNIAVGYFRPGSAPDLTAQVGLNTEAQMFGLRVGCYIRVPFTLPPGQSLVGLRLKVQYDDAFAAFVNGQNAAASNPAGGAPAGVNTSPAFAALTSESAAVASHNPTNIEEYNLDAFVGAVGETGNVLALHMMNVSSGSSDVFVEPQLVGKVAGGTGITGYFATATPGTLNGGNETILLPQTVALSRPSGTFQTTFNLTLGGAIAGQVIRYVIADPSGTGANNIAEPTAASTLYTGPISIPGSKIIRAAVFTTDGTQKGRTNTAQYLLLETGGTNNTSAFTSNLPIIVLNDHGFGQPVFGDSLSYTTGHMHVFEPVAGVASLNGATGNGVPVLSNRMGFRYRGSSSSGFLKKSYGLEIWDEKNNDTDLPLLGLAADSDWIFNGPYQYDDTFIHNAFIYEVSRLAGRWAPRTKFCEVFVDQNGGKLDYQDYNGVYVLTEKIKSNSDRLDITGLTPVDNTGEAVTGGYIFKIDRAEPDEVQWTTANNVPAASSGTFLVLGEPDPGFDTAAQVSYIQNYVQQFDTAVFSEANTNFATRTYRNFIDVPSFIDHHILNSMAFNVDALRLSAFFFKDRNGKINAGPLWDFDRALGSDDGRDANPATWNNITYFFDAAWWGRLFKDPEFVQAWVDRWWEWRQPGGPLELAQLTAISNAMGNEIGNAAGARDAAKWAQNAPDAGQNYLNEITKMNTWMSQRIAWIDSQLPTPANASLASGAVAPGTNVTLTGSGTLRYTLDGSDPRPAGGGASSPALTYTGPITINETTVITVRSQTTTTPFPNGAVSIGWGPPRTYVFLVNEFFAVNGDIAVSEINYHPLGPTAAELTALPGVGTNDFEFIELRNVGSRKANTFELKFNEGFPFQDRIKLKPRSLNPGDFALVVKNRAAFELRYGTAMSAKIIGEWGAGNISDNGEELRLVARDNSAIQTFTFDDQNDWPSRPDGKGSGLEYIGTAFTNAAFNNAFNWRASSEFHGSPGIAGTGPDPRLAINEILSHSNLPHVDALEVKNLTAAPLNIGGWYLSDRGSAETADDYKQFRIPDGTSLPAGGYRVWTEVEFNPNGAWNPTPGTPGPGEFAFDADHGDDAWVIEADASGKLLKFVDHVDFGAARPDETWGRWPDGIGRLQPMAARTLFDEPSATTPRPGLGAENALPRVGPLVITEVQHTPLGGDPDLEFVELFNPTATAQPLAQWKLRGAVDYDFASESLAPNATLVLVPFAPSDTPKANAFRNAYGIGLGVTLVGPWSTDDHLDVTGEVVLQRAETPPVSEPYYFPLTIEDETNYANDGDWPTATLGNSLNRRRTLGPGDAAASWETKTASPGTYILNNAPLAQNDPYHTPLTGGALVLNVRANDSDPDNDPLVITQTSAAANGTAATDGAMVQYTPGGSYTGNDTFTYTVADGFGGTANATVTLSNALPVTSADTLHAPVVGGTATLDVRTNDSDADLDPLTIAAVGTPANGTANTNGATITFTPGVGFNGNDTFSYTIADGYGGTATTNVTLTNTVPVAGADNLRVAFTGGGTVLDVRGNDSDADNDALTIASVSTPANGTATTNGTTITYTPGVGYVGNDTFSYTIADGFGATATATVTLSNAAPVAGPDMLHVPLTGSDLVLNVRANDSDANSDVLTITTVGAATHGTTTTNGTTITYTPGGSFAGNDSFNYTITDGYGATATGLVMLVNAAPVASADAYHLPLTGGVLTLAVRANDSDSDNDALAITNVSAASAGIATTNGTFVDYQPGTNFNGNDTFTYTIADGHGGTATANVALTNALPIAANDNAASEGVAVSISVLANDTDADNDTLALTSVTNGAAGTTELNGTSITYTPGPAYAGDDAFTYTIADGHGGTATGTVTVRASGVLVGSLAETGAALAGGVVQGLQVPALGSDGLVAWLASVSGKKTALVTGPPAQMVTATKEAVPGLAGLTFSKLTPPVCDGAGRVVFLGTFTGAGVSAKKKNDRAIFASMPGGATTVIARLGETPADLPGTKFASFTALDAVGGETLYLAKLARGGSVSGANDTGVWAWDGTTSRLVLRTGDVLSTSGGFKSVAKLSLLGAVAGSPGHGRSHRTGEVAMRVDFTDKSSGLVLAQFDSGAWAKTVPAIAGKNLAFTSLRAPSLATAGSAAALAGLPGDVSALVLFGVGAPVEIARSGGASGLAGATFKSFSDPAAATGGQIAFTAKLAGAPRGTDTALFWRDSAGTLTALARLGDAAANASGAAWKKFTSFALADGDDRGPVFLAELGGAGVTKKNKVALYARDTTGALVKLARTGETLTVGGAARTLTKLTLLNALPPVQGSTRSFNDAGRIACLATFADGKQAIVTLRVP